MMGVYIKGIQMPKENQRGLWVVIHSDGTVEYDTGDYGWQTLQQSAFNVPPHGRLIEEADAIETAWMILRGIGYLKEENPQLEQTVREVFATAPAI